MKKILKSGLILLIILLISSAVGVAYVRAFLPSIPLNDGLKVEVTPERVERGKYLATHVAMCVDCHSERDWARFAGPMVPGSLGRGGEVFNQDLGFPGEFYAPNISGSALKSWSDAELYRAITSGVSKDGRPLFPVMPYPSFRQMATEDVLSIIAYLRTIPDNPKEVPLSKADFPMSVIMHLIPKKAAPTDEPPRSDTVAYGAYLAKTAACGDCHTKTEKGKIVGEAYAGGFEFRMPGGNLLRSANITPHPVSGIGAWTKETFIQRFKAFAKEDYVPAKVDVIAGEMQTPMPWGMYAGMTEEDLGAIFEFLKSLSPVENAVERWQKKSN